MVEFGLFSNEEELEAIVHPLVSLLDGTFEVVTDRKEFLSLALANSGLSQNKTRLFSEIASYAKMTQTERYQIKEGSELVMQCKCLVCSILLSIIDLRLDMKLSNFLIRFRDSLLTARSDPCTVTPRHTRLQSSEELLLPKKKPSEDFPSPRSPAGPKVSPVAENPVDWIEDILADSTLDLAVCTTKNLVAINIDLLLYQSPELVNAAFTLLLRYHGQRHSLLNSLLNIQILENDEAIRALETLNESMALLSTLAENAEFWLAKKYEQGFINPRAMDLYGTDEKLLIAHTQVCDTLFTMTKFCFKELVLTPEAAVSDEPEFEQSVQKAGRKTPESSVHRGAGASLYTLISQSSDAFGTDPRLFSPTEVPNSEFQRLLRNMRAFSPVMEIVRHSATEQFYSRERHQLVLRFCFVFLAKFCKGNPQNQEILSHFVDYFIEAIPTSVFVLSLIREVYADNTKLCSRVPVRVLRYLSIAIGDIPLSAKKCEVIRLLATFVSVSGKLIPRNQTEIIRQLANYEAESFKALFDSPEELSELQRMSNSVIRSYVSSASKTAYRAIAVPLEIQYFVEMLGIMSMCCENKNAHAEKLCQQLVSMGKMKELLTASSLLWVLKRALLLLFLHTHLDIEYSVQQDDDDVWTIVSDLANDLNYIYDVYTRSGAQYTPGVEQVQLSLFDGSASLSSLAQSYVYEAAIPCLRLVLIKRGSNIPSDWSAEVLKGLVSRVCEFHRISPKLEFSRTTSEFLVLVADIDRLSGYLEQVSIAELQRSREGYRQLAKGGTKENTPEAGTKAVKLRSLVKGLIESESVREAVDAEFNTMVYSFMSVDRLTEAAFGSAFTMQPKDLYHALIDALDINEINVKDELLERGLKLLRKSIELEVKSQRTPAADWDTDDWIKYEKEITARQDMFASLGCARLVCNMISFKRDAGIRCESVLLGIALLLGGNRSAQEKFMEYMQGDAGNRFLSELKQMLVGFFESTKCDQMHIVRQSQREVPGDPLVLATLMGVSNDVHGGGERRGSCGRGACRGGGRGVRPGLLSVHSLPPADQLAALPAAAVRRTLRTDARPPQRSGLTERTEDRRHAARHQLRLRPAHQRVSRPVHKDAAQGQHPPGVPAPRHTHRSRSYCLPSRHWPTLYLKPRNSEERRERKGSGRGVQGPCRGNQRLLSQPRSIETSRDLLLSLKLPEDRKARGFHLASTHDLISTLKSKTVNFLLSLLEGDADVEISRHISESLDFDMCKTRMLEVFQSFVREELKMEFGPAVGNGVRDKLERDSFKGAVEEGFNLYVLMSKLADVYPGARKYTDLANFKSDDELLAFSFFKTHTARIEVVICDSLQRIYFPIHPICKYISDESKDSMMFVVNRDSPSSKVTDLLQKADDLIAEMEHNYTLRRKGFLLNSDGVLFLRKCSLALAVFINYLMLFNYDFTIEEMNYIPSACNTAILAVGVVLISLATVIVIMWCVLKAKLIVRKGWKERTARSQAICLLGRSQSDLEVPTDVPASSLPVRTTLQVLFLHGPEHPLFNREGRRHFGNAITAIAYVWACLKMVITTGTFQYFCLYVALAALGFWDIFFYSFLLLDVTFMFPTLHNVFDALTLNGNQLLLTFLLLLVLVYIYGLWGFYIDPTMFYDATIGTFGESLCQSLWECTLTTFNNGLRLTGGIGDILVKVPWDQKRKWYDKWIYELSFFIIVVVIMLNIFLGIIVSTFAQLRDEKKGIKEDMENVCFICGISRQTFDKDGDGFDVHIHSDHYLWNYINFIVHLREKDPTEYTGVESYIAKMLGEHKIEWVPVNRALVLRNEKQDDKPALDDFFENMKELEAEVREVSRLVDTLRQH